VAAKLHLELAGPFVIAGHAHHVSVSIGASVYPEGGDTSESLLRAADQAMYQAKQRGSSGTLFVPALAYQQSDRLRLSDALRKALDAREFVLHYQPRVDAASGKIVGVESLLRWQHAELGLLTADRFLPLAEELGLMTAIGHWVLDEACTQGVRWGVGHARRPPRISVNFSGGELSHPEFMETVASTLDRTGLAADRLELEITERDAMCDELATASSLSALDELGVHLCIDDFGVGHSSLSRLKRMPVDMLKIDRSFIRDVVDDPLDATIVDAIIAMAHGLGLRVVAEGIETAEQERHMVRHRCDELQGFHISLPHPPEFVGAMFAEGRCA
jgi:EAL domain-containing protein (putative c-di-GMP-specific phosphodiesterase class I)